MEYEEKWVYGNKRISSQINEGALNIMANCTRKIYSVPLLNSAFYFWTWFYHMVLSRELDMSFIIICVGENSIGKVLVPEGKD